MKAIRALFSGDVQGVGFRWTAKKYATQLGLFGTVRNLSKGSVELIAMGSEEKLTTLIEQLKSKFASTPEVHYLDQLPSNNTFEIIP